MGDANPIRTLGDYSKPSHEGYRNTIELPKGNNVFREETDKTTDLHQHLSRICSQRLETASQITRDAVITLTKTASQESMMASEYTT
ncbi:hypothetical protein Tco_0138187 [Tanacetum coccineum]